MNSLLMIKDKGIFPIYSSLKNHIQLSILFQSDCQKYPWKDKITHYSPYEQPRNYKQLRCPLAFHSSHQAACSSLLTILEALHCGRPPVYQCLEMGSPEPAFHSRKCGAEENNHFLQPPGCPFINAAPCAFVTSAFIFLSFTLLSW